MPENNFWDELKYPPVFFDMCILSVTSRRHNLAVTHIFENDNTSLTIISHLHVTFLYLFISCFVNILFNKLFYIYLMSCLKNH